MGAVMGGNLHLVAPKYRKMIMAISKSSMESAQLKNAGIPLSALDKGAFDLGTTSETTKPKVDAPNTATKGAEFTRKNVLTDEMITNGQLNEKFKLESRGLATKTGDKISKYFFLETKNGRLVFLNEAGNKILMTHGQFAKMKDVTYLTKNAEVNLALVLKETVAKYNKSAKGHVDCSVLKVSATQKVPPSLQDSYKSYENHVKKVATPKPPKEAVASKGVKPPSEKSKSPKKAVADNKKAAAKPNAKIGAARTIGGGVIFASLGYLLSDTMFPDTEEKNQEFLDSLKTDLNGVHRANYMEEDPLSVAQYLWKSHEHILDKEKTGCIEGYSVNPALLEELKQICKLQDRSSNNSINVSKPSDSTSTAE
jgi:hypothetical protein